MKRFIFISIILLFSLSLCGCEVIAPSQSKAFSEKKQVELQEEENTQLKRIADSLERIEKGL